MHSKTHRNNHDFQIAYFLAGACQTADGAYAMLCDLKEDREKAVEGFEVSKLKTEARRIRAARKLEGDVADRLEAQADLLEIDQSKAFGVTLYEAALAEIAFIDKCIEKIQPLRKFAHLSDPEAHEAMQREEWKGELIRRAENYLLSDGRIPTDEFNHMRMHPDFKSGIFPEITRIQKHILDNKPAIDLLGRPGIQGLLGE